MSKCVVVSDCPLQERKCTTENTLLILLYPTNPLHPITSLPVSTTVSTTHHPHITRTCRGKDCESVRWRCSTFILVNMRASTTRFSEATGM